jgi:hypothetical protein
MRKLKADDGNVVIELALAVLLFGTLLIPAIESLARVAAAYRIADAASVAVARAWTVTETADRAAVVTALRAQLVQKSAMPLRINVSCTPACDASAQSISVTSRVMTGAIGEIASTFSLERDAYGQ